MPHLKIKITQNNNHSLACEINLSNINFSIFFNGLDGVINITTIIVQVQEERKHFVSKNTSQHSFRKGWFCQEDNAAINAQNHNSNS